MAAYRKPNKTSNPIADDKEDVTWNHYTFRLPAVVGEDASVVDKAQFFAETDAAISSTAAPFRTKIEVFRSRFGHDTLITEIIGDLAAFYNDTLEISSPIVLQANAGFVYNDVQLRNQHGQTLAMPAPGAAAIPVATQNAARFLSFTVTLNPGLVYTGQPEVLTEAQLPTLRLPGCFQLPTQEAGGATQLHPNIGPAIVNSVPLAFATTQAIAHGAPTIGQITRVQNNVPLVLQTTDFNEAFSELFNESKYRLLRVLMRKEYVGVNVNIGTGIMDRLRKVRQQQYVNGTLQSHTVGQYYEEFQRVLNTAPKGQAYTFDIVELFHAGLSPDMTRACEANNVNLVPRPPNEAQAAALYRLRTFYTQVEQLQAQASNIRRIVQQEARLGRGTAARRSTAFAALPHMAHEDDTLNELLWQGEEVNAFLGTAQQDATEVPQLSDAMVTASVHLSVCEEAMQKATNSRFPQPECWGCTNHSNAEFHNNRFHRWHRCPHRNDPEAQRKAQQGIDEFVKRKQQASAYTRVAVPESDDAARKLGFPSARLAEVFHSITEASTMPAVRKALCKEVTSGATNPAVGSATSEAAMATTGNQEGNKKRKATFFSFPVIPLLNAIAQVMEALRRVFDAPVQITQNMPHIRLPIGAGDGKAVLECMTDSCAGLNLGNLAYHKSIYERCPELVHQFGYIKDYDNIEEFDVGGVASDGARAKVVAVITYKMPYRVNGVPTTMSFALSENTSANTILGVTVLRSSKTILCFDDHGNDAMIMQKLGATFPIAYHPPLLADQAPQEATGYPSSFPVVTDVTPELTTHIQGMRQQLHASLTSENPDDHTDYMVDDEWPPAPAPPLVPGFVAASVQTQE